MPEFRFERLDGWSFKWCSLMNGLQASHLESEFHSCGGLHHVRHVLAYYGVHVFRESVQPIEKPYTVHVAPLVVCCYLGRGAR